MKKIEYSRHDRFEKQIKKLGHPKKYPSIEEDLLEAQKSAIELCHIHGLDNDSVELVPKYDRKTVQIWKIKKFACKSIVGKGVKSGIRVIYAFYPEKFEVEFLEIYFKEKNSTDMDYDFVSKYINNITLKGI